MHSFIHYLFILPGQALPSIVIYYRFDISFGIFPFMIPWGCVPSCIKCALVVNLNLNDLKGHLSVHFLKTLKYSCC